MKYKRAITTPDGYFFEQLPNGMFTDGDVEFNLSDMRGGVWQCMDKYWCADACREQRSVKKINKKLFHNSPTWFS